MQPTDTLATLFGHHRWANLAIVDRCAALTPEQLDTTMLGGFGSLRATLEHIATAERSYFSRISTGQPYRHPADAPPLTLEEIAASLRTTGDGLLAWAGRVSTDETVMIDWDGTPREVPKTVLLTQAVNHATEHRAQVMALLTQLGIEPPELSGWEFFAALNGW